MLFSSFWKRGTGPPLWGPGGVLGPLDPPPWIRPSETRVFVGREAREEIPRCFHTYSPVLLLNILYQCAKFGDDWTLFNVIFDVCNV